MAITLTGTTIGVGFIIVGILPHVTGFIIFDFNPFATQTTQKPDTVYCGNKWCHHGDCDTHYFPHTCHCEFGYEGDTCNNLTIPNIACEVLQHHCYYGHCVMDQSTYQYYCICDSGYSGPSCSDQTTPSPHTVTKTPTTTTAPTTAMPITTTTTSTSSTTTPSTTPTTSTMTTTTSAPLLHFYDCDKLKTVMDIGNKIPQTNPNVTHCSSGSDATPEAFVMDLCNTPLPPSWTQGVNVMQHCDSIPLYTPVATFYKQRYSSSGGFSGIFLGCLPNGFKLGGQPCDKSPQILHLEAGGVYTMNPDEYYTVA